MSKLINKTILITGGSQGIGKAMGLRCAQEGANIVVVAKENTKSLESLISEFEPFKGKIIALNIDIQDETQIHEAVKIAVSTFGSINALINNTSATLFVNTADTKAEDFDRMIATSVRSAFLFSRECLPYLKQASKAHIINISPPLFMDPKWFKNHLGFTISKYAMSLCTFGMAEEFKPYNIAVNSLWPESTIATQTIKDHLSEKVYQSSRWPKIMGDAALELLQKSSKEATGMFFTDEALLKASGVKDFSQYAVNPDIELTQALYVSKNNPLVPLNQEMFK